ncbi:MAG: MlaD family protein [Desulfobacterales bacterium]|nr:MlaD family protein [Desulfobacterales bacterium]
MKIAPRIHPMLTALILGAALTLMGCNAHRFSIHFNQINGLEATSPVVFKNTPVGRVSKVEYTSKGQFRVTLEIPREFTHTATEYSRFFVGSYKNRPAVIIEQDRAGGNPIAQDSDIQGEDRSPARRIEGFFDQVEKRAKAWLSELENIPATEEYQGLKEKLAELETRLRTSGKQAGETFEKKILPLLEEKIKALTEKLKEMGETEKAKELEQELDRLQTL